MVLSALLGQGPAYIAFVGWALAQQLSIPRQFRKTQIKDDVTINFKLVVEKPPFKPSALSPEIRKTAPF